MQRASSRKNKQCLCNHWLGPRLREPASWIPPAARALFTHPGMYLFLSRDEALPCCMNLGTLAWYLGSRLQLQGVPKWSLTSNRCLLPFPSFSQHWLTPIECYRFRRLSTLPVIMTKVRRSPSYKWIFFEKEVYNACGFIFIIESMPMNKTHLGLPIVVNVSMNIRSVVGIDEKKEQIT